jgi:ornithine cyclodeaminase/alanine dehydrogenase-like protein (mu-crystallin family)
VRYLSAQDLEHLAAPATLVAAIERALRDFAQGQVTVPARQHFECGNNTVLSMPVIGATAFGAKLVSVVPGNADRGLPVTNGLMMLSDGQSGLPLAVLNAAALTALRTGAVGALALEHIAPARVDRVGIIGTGVQGTWQAIFACAVRPITTVCFVARSQESARRFVDAVAPRVPSVKLVRCQDAGELLRECPVIIAATTSAEPVLPNEPALLEGKHYLSIGSFRPAMQELPNAVYELAGCVVVDSDAARQEAGDLINPLAAGVLREEAIYHLAQLIDGTHSVDVRRTTVFKSVGMALYDLYAASALVAEAQRVGRGTVLESESAQRRPPVA